MIVRRVALAAAAISVLSFPSPSQSPKFEPIRSVKYFFEGTVHRADITYIGEDMGVVQVKSVEVPSSVSLTFRRGDLVSVMAQKTRYEIPDTLSIRPRNRVIDDGYSGTIKVRIEINGSTAYRGESSEPFGIAKANGAVK